MNRCQLIQCFQNIIVVILLIIIHAHTITTHLVTLVQIRQIQYIHVIACLQTRIPLIQIIHVALSHRVNPTFQWPFRIISFDVPVKIHQYLAIIIFYVTLLKSKLDTNTIY